MGAEQEVKIIIGEAEENIKSLKDATKDDQVGEKLDALRECIYLLGAKIDENAGYITEIYKEIAMLKEKI